MGPALPTTRGPAHTGRGSLLSRGYDWTERLKYLARACADPKDGARVVQEIGFVWSSSSDVFFFLLRSFLFGSFNLFAWAKAAKITMHDTNARESFAVTGDGVSESSKGFFIMKRD